jgi:phage shock protein A
VDGDVDSYWETLMGILGRMSSVIKSNLNDLISKMEDPGKQVEQMIDDMQDQVRQARGEVVTALTAEKRLATRREELARELAVWDDRAMKAVRAGDDGLAREALIRKGRVGEELKKVEGEYRTQTEYVDALKTSLKAMEARIEEIKARKGTIKAKVGAGGNPLGSTDSFDTFDRMAERIDRSEDEGTAAAELADLGGKDDLERKFRELENRAGSQPGAAPAASPVDDELADLKRRLDS